MLCYACLPSALTTLTNADSSLFNTAGVCLSHMSKSCAKYDASTLLTVLESHRVSKPTLAALRVKVGQARHKTRLLTEPTALLAVCGTCGKTGSVSMPDRTKYVKDPFVVCTTCSSSSTATAAAAANKHGIWCLSCQTTVNGRAVPYKPSVRACAGFEFVTVAQYYTVVAGACADFAPNSAAHHRRCGRVYDLSGMVKQIQSAKLYSMPAGSVPSCVGATRHARIATPSGRFVSWAFGVTAAPPVGVESKDSLTLPSAKELLHTLRGLFLSYNMPDAQGASVHTLNILYERAFSQQCFKCGKTGVKDTHCTHITCCGGVWCYVCEQRVGKAHKCPVNLERGDLTRYESGQLLSAVDAVTWFHVAKLARYARSWLCTVGVTHGLFTLLTHSSWSVFLAQHAQLVFHTDIEQAWFQSVRLCDDVCRECYF